MLVVKGLWVSKVPLITDSVVVVGMVGSNTSQCTRYSSGMVVGYI